MYSLSVVPLIPGISKDTLTYLSSVKPVFGDCIKVPFRNKEIDALVLDITSIRENKSEIKNADYAFKRVATLTKSTVSISPSFTKSLLESTLLSKNFLSDILYTLIPNSSFLDTYKIGSPMASSYKKEYLESSLLETVSNIEALLKKFSKPCIIVPTIERAEYLHSELQRHGFSSAVLHGSLSQKKQAQAISLAQENDCVTVCTPTFLSLAVHTDALFIDSYNSEHFKLKKYPDFPLLYFIEQFALYSNLPLYALDPLHIQEQTKKSYISNAQVLPIDMTDSIEGTKSIWLSKTLEKEMVTVLKSKGRVLLYVSRKGLSTSLICKTCKNQVSCDVCGGALSLHATSTNRFTRCSNCLTTTVLNKDIPLTCKVCSGIDIEQFGIGTQMVADELMQFGVETFLYDADTVSTEAKTKKLIKEFEETPASILVATDISISRFSKPVDLVAVVSMDSRASIPYYSNDFRTTRTIYNLSKLSTKNTIYIQTRLKRTYFFKMLFDGKALAEIRDDYREKVKEFLYPPYGVLIECSSKRPFDKNIVLSLEKELGQKIYICFYKNIYMLLLKHSVDTSNQTLQEEVEILTRAFPGSFIRATK